MAYLTRLFKAIELFTENAYKKPIWIIATSILVSSWLYIVVSYQLSRPEEQASLENAINERKVEIEDSERMIKLYEEIFAERESAIRATGNFSALFRDVRDSGQLIGREQQLKESYQLAVEARKQAELTIAKLQGTVFRVAYLNELLRGNEGSMETDISALKLIEELCGTYLTGDVQEFDRQILQSGDRINGIIKEQNTSLAQMESQSLNMKSAIDLNQLKLKRAYEQNERHRLKGLFQIPVVIFTLGYLAFIRRGISKFLVKPGQVSMRQRQNISTSKKRRKRR